MANQLLKDHMQWKQQKMKGDLLAVLTLSTSVTNVMQCSIENAAVQGE